MRYLFAFPALDIIYNDIHTHKNTFITKSDKYWNAEQTWKH